MLGHRSSSGNSWSRARSVVAVIAVVAIVAAAGGWIVQSATRAQAAGPCTAPIVNKVACENTKTGTPESVWYQDAPDDSIAGFPTSYSVNVGQTQSFKIATTAHAYTIDIYRLGYYGGDGARKVATVAPSASLPQIQPSCLTDSTGLYDCGNWGVSASWAVPSDAVSGVYDAILTRTDTGGSNEVLFVVRDDSSHADIVYQTSDTTYQAYNRYGGNSLYYGSAPNSFNGRAYKVSYNRPLGDGVGENSLFNAEYPMIRWMESNGYDMSYIGGADTDRSGSLLLNHKLFMSSGHDEYWSGQQRANVEAARDAGVNLAFFSGNEVFWKTRWENSIDASGTPYRTLVTYKETLDGAKIDPSPQWTGTWMDPRFSPPSDGGRPQNALTGTLFSVSGPRDDAITVPAADGKLRFWRNTSIASLGTGQSATLPQGILGMEWDSDTDNGFRPAGLVDMTHTTVNIPEGSGPYVLKDNGSQYGGGNPSHSVTLYRAPSGALVFSTGTVQWAWSLDSHHLTITGTGAVDSRVQQATVNVLADLGAQPATLQSGLASAAASTDHTAPTITITSPAAGSSVQVGVQTTITGTATDAGGGVVGGVEVSTDGGATWHQAQGRESWTYPWTPSANGSTTLLVRATDDSANTSANKSVVVNGVWTCPCSIFPSSSAPAAQTTDATPLEMGVKFRAQVNGVVTGVRFYKAAGNTGTHTGTLWSSTGQQLATATFTNETASGWQQVLFSQPVTVSANTTYVVSYFAPSGMYSYTAGQFGASGYTTAPLTALQDGLDGANGVYKAGTSGFPTDSFGSANYWVDVVFSDQVPPDSIPPTVTGRSPVAGSTGVSVSDPVTVTFSEAMTQGSVAVTLRDPANNVVPATLNYSSVFNTASLTPNAPLASSTTYTVSVTGTDLGGNALQGSPVTWTFTTGGLGSCPCRIFSSSATPQTSASTDTTAVEVGVKFRSDVNGWVNGVRFYKGAGNSGTHTGTLWSPTGQQLATATFTSETATGWQQVLFASPVQVTANTTYVVSYFAPAGHYAYTANQFGAGGVDNPPLHALASGTDGLNGVYRYGSTGFPTDSFGAANYWVDVVFGTTPPPDLTAPTVVTSSPAGGSTGVSITDPVVVTFSEAMTQASVALTLRDPANNVVPATLNYSAAFNTATLTPNAPLAQGTTYSVSVTGSDLSGNALQGSPISWSFTTGGLATCPCRIFSSSATPQNATTSDAAPTEVGVKFRSDVNGWINGVRFYKGAGNTGTHTGSLWSASGLQLATATFTSETASGWQEVLFAEPVQVTANTTYVVSYFAPAGHYAYTSNQFSAGGVDNSPLHALGSGVDGLNGVFKYDSSGFPRESYGDTNYWVDAVFGTTPPPDLKAPTVTGRSPVGGSTGVSVSDPVTVTFSEAMAQGSLAVTLRDPGSNVVPGSLSYSSATNTATLTPNAPLAPATTYSVSVTGTDPAGNALQGSPVSWSFTTGGVETCPCRIFSSTATPANQTSDATPLEVGVKFRSDINGYVNGVRFYKAAGNTGTHTGTLWSSTGQQLATATFTNETASGWQEVYFSPSVLVTANTTYVVSYFAPNGQYSYTSNQFGAAGVDNPPLHALASGADGLNGVYLYGSTGFPTSSFGNTNYWVDVIFGLTNNPPPQAQAITFNPLASVNYGQAPVTVSATGGGSGNPVTFTTSTSAVCTAGGTNGATITIVGAGTCSVTAAQAGNSTFAAATPVTQSFTVAPVALSVTATNASKVYGQANPAFGTSITGFVGGQTLATSGVTGAASCTSSATPSSAVGTYPITCTAGTLTAQNYTFTYAPGTLSVTKAPLTVTANSVTKTQGDANPTIGATLTGFALGQTLGTSGVTGTAACTTTATTASPVGTYPITCTAGTLASGNYSFGPFVAGTLTVAAPNLAFTTAAQSLLTTGITSGTITIQRQNADGTPRTTGALTVSLSTNPSNGVFRNTADSATITSVSIPSGSSGVSFRYRPASAGTPSVNVSGSGVSSGSQVETVQNPTLVITTAPQTIVHGQTSSAMTVTRRNADGTANTNGSLTVQLSSTPSNGSFRDGTLGLITITSVTISSGSSTANFRYRPANAGTPAVNVTGSGYTSGSQVQTVT